MIIEIVMLIIVAAINIICWYAGWFYSFKKNGSFLSIFVALIAYILTMHYLLVIKDELFVTKNYIYYGLSIAMFLLYVYIARKAFLRAKY
jgi:hypothetical protein